MSQAGKGGMAVGELKHGAVRCLLAHGSKRGGGLIEQWKATIGGQVPERHREGPASGLYWSHKAGGLGSETDLLCPQTLGLWQMPAVRRKVCWPEGMPPLM